MRTCPAEYGEPAWVNKDEAPAITSYRVMIDTTSIVTGKPTQLTLLRGASFEEATKFAKEYAVEKNVAVDVYARFDNGFFMAACGYQGNDGELVTDFEEEEPEYDQDYAKEF